MLSKENLAIVTVTFLPRDVPPGGTCNAACNGNFCIAQASVYLLLQLMAINR